MTPRFGATDVFALLIRVLLVPQVRLNKYGNLSENDLAVLAGINCCVLGNDRRARAAK
jgi:hypothetical protein